MAQDSSPLYDDIKAAERVSSALVPASGPSGQADVAALERGVREHPSGVTEHYERVEFRER